MGSLCEFESKSSVEVGQPAAVPRAPPIASLVAEAKAQKAIHEDPHKTLNTGIPPKAPPVRRSSRQSADSESRDADTLKNLNALYQMAGPKQ
jgi:hypothetical protein